MVSVFGGISDSRGMEEWKGVMKRALVKYVIGLPGYWKAFVCGLAQQGVS